MYLIPALSVALALGLALSIREKKFYAGRLAACLVVGFAVGAVLSCARVIPAGHVGVVDIFGQVAERPLTPGLKLVNPLANIVPLSVRTQEDKETMEVPSKEGLTIQLEVSVLYRLDPEKAVE